MVKQYVFSHKALVSILLTLGVFFGGLQSLNALPGVGIRVDHGDRPIGGQDSGMVEKGKGKGPGPKKSVSSQSGAKGQNSSGPATPP